MFLLWVVGGEEGMCAYMCVRVCRRQRTTSAVIPSDSLHLLGGTYWSAAACIVRLEWLANESQVPCLSLPSFGMTDVDYNTCHFYVSSRD